MVACFDSDTSLYRKAVFLESLGLTLCAYILQGVLGSLSQ